MLPRMIYFGGSLLMVLTSGWDLSSPDSAIIETRERKPGYGE